MSAVLEASAVRLRPMRESDLDAVIEIERGAYEFPWSIGVFRDCLRVGYCCWVLEELGLVHGYGVMQAGAGESHVLNLCVRASRQGEGLGRQLLGRLLEVARDHRSATVYLEVRPTNRPARRLYEGMGFTEAGVRKRYYPRRHGREDALVLTRTLDDVAPG